LWLFCDVVVVVVLCGIIRKLNANVIKILNLALTGFAIVFVEKFPDNFTLPLSDGSFCIVANAVFLVFFLFFFQEK
jgi:hypothetical protein